MPFPDFGGFEPAGKKCPVTQFLLPFQHLEYFTDMGFGTGKQVIV
jgi:hypothetical protein